MVLDESKGMNGMMSLARRHLLLGYFDINMAATKTHSLSGVICVGEVPGIV